MNNRGTKLVLGVLVRDDKHDFLADRAEEDADTAAAAAVRQWKSPDYSKSMGRHTVGDGPCAHAVCPQPASVSAAFVYTWLCACTCLCVAHFIL